MSPGLPDGVTYLMVGVEVSAEEDGTLAPDRGRPGWTGLSSTWIDRGKGLANRVRLLHVAERREPTE